MVLSFSSINILQKLRISVFIGTLLLFLVILVSLTLFITTRNSKDEETFYPTNQNPLFQKTSNFLNSNKKYRCTGICYCEKEEEQRKNNFATATKSVPRNFIFLLAGVISYELASKHFQKSCEKELSSDCTVHSIKGSVEECEDIDEKESKEDGVQDEEMEKYKCEGHCLPDKTYLEESIRPGCQTMKYFEIMKFLGAECANSEIKKEVYVKKQEDPEVVFEQTILRPQCEKVGYSIYEEFLQKFGFADDGTKKSSSSICVTSNPPGYGNHSLKCKGLESLDNHHFYWGKKDGVQKKWRKKWSDADKPPDEK